MEIVKNLQRLSGIDGEYDNDSGSGPDRIARRRTVYNLEKASKPRRQIGTLDVAFKKRFLKLTSAENNPSACLRPHAITSPPHRSVSHHSLCSVSLFVFAASPLLTRQMTMRRETIRALEVRKNSIMAERNKSAMQTLGANNEYAVNPNVANNNLGVPVRNTRTSNAGISVKDVFDPNGGQPTPSAVQLYGGGAVGGAPIGAVGAVGGGGQTNLSYEHEDGDAMHMSPRSQVSWSNNVSGRM